ncbi:MAG: DUF2062 domain-containing protein [Pirellulaceae bacterium]
MKFVSDKLNHYWKQAKDFCVYKILHADDPPHRLALGIAIGMFVTFLPLIGVQMVLSVFLAWLLRANKLVGVPLVWISNPLTMGPIYYPCYVLGCKLLGMAAIDDEWSKLVRNWQTLQNDPNVTFGNKVGFWWQGLLEFMGPLGLGCLIVASVAGVLSYYVSLLAIRSYRLRRWGQLMPPSLTPVDHEDEATTLHSKESGNAA